MRLPAPEGRRACICQRMLWATPTPVLLAHPLHAPRIFNAVADVAANDLGQLIAKIVGQLLVGEVMERAVTRPEWDIEWPDTLTQHAR
jgi:hypothetical protein